MDFDLCEVKEKRSVFDIIVNEREFIYPILFYVSGLILGSFCFRLFDTTAVLKVLKGLFEPTKAAFLPMFTGNFVLYFAVFMVSLLLGLCLIGYPVINIIPLIMGVVISVKISYYYITYATKGIGYSLLMIIPESSILVTAILYTVSTGSKLSKYILDATAGKQTAGEFKIKSLLKSYLVYALAVTLSALLNSLLTYLLSGIIRI